MSEYICIRLQKDVQDERSQILLSAVQEIFDLDDPRVLKLKEFMSGFEDSSWILTCTPDEANVAPMLVLREKCDDLYGRNVTFVRLCERTGDVKWRVGYSRLLVDELQESENIPFRDPLFVPKHFYMKEPEAMVFASGIMRMINILRKP